MTDAPFYHVGIVVEDLDAAIPHFAEAFQITFNAPSVMPCQIQNPDGSSYDSEMRVTYSKDGPPYIELMQGHESGFASLQQGEGLHHIGLWVPPETTLDNADRFRLLHTDVVVVAGGPLIHTDHTTLHGIRLELVNEASRPGIEAWIQNGPPA